MAYQNILVGVDNSDPAKRRIVSAANLAHRFGAALTGVFLESTRVSNYLASDSFAVPPIDNLELAVKEREQQTAAASAAARTHFDAVVRDARVPFFWLDIDGDSAGEMISCARRHDLVVLPEKLGSALGDNAISAEEVAMACGGPVLVMPQGGYPQEIGRRVLVAWKDSRESSRAIRDAMPFLRQAEEIHFLTVTQDASPQEDELLQRRLHRHGCRPANLIVDSDGDTPPGEIIRRHVDMIGTDLIVLGLYGHSRIHELVLGGVSRDLLTALPMPLLVSH